ncbi:hypothetical protein AKJ63_00900 [candidate division MSBL1 archaeon SCGC-AAA259D18]|uniref:Transglutaminase-like domain-containing protein n=1 Tax=candidate division MSBL1 archaeon SCGC-AAA259D18 TaxID=1698262 RepID=A0A133UC84_9EURY|nr:hypothetical protein AKJ63_00900 [candidate division MSBL1 archaeon SCGC-AAA259D18]
MSKKPGRAENPYKQAKKLYQWIMENMQEKPSPPHERGAESSLISKEGDCGDYSFIFTAACRVLGIPARPVFGEFLSKRGNKQRRAHAWANFISQNMGGFPSIQPLRRELN